MEKHSITKVLEHYGCSSVPDRPGWNKIKCPFHDDSHASAGVNTTENVFVCHGCGIKGDTYKIIMEKEGVSFREANKFAEGITGESSDNLSRVNSSGGRVSSTQRSNNARRRYNPPGRGRRTATRT